MNSHDNDRAVAKGGCTVPESLRISHLAQRRAQLFSQFNRIQFNFRVAAESWMSSDMQAERSLFNATTD
jgi:hypothetical protein